jgi:hypothetical protein
MNLREFGDRHVRQALEAKGAIPFLKEAGG